MRVAIVGAGISGLAAAHVLATAGVEVVLYEKEECVGGQARTVTADGVDVDLGFMPFDRVSYPDMVEFLETLEVDIEASDMSFSVSLDGGKGYEWGSRNGLSSLFAQKRNVVNPYFWRMIREVMKFKDDVHKYLEELEYNPDMNRRESLRHFIKSHGYSDLFQRAYLVPICSSIWPCPSESVLDFSAFSVLSFCHDYLALQLFGWPQSFTIKEPSHCYYGKVRKELEKRCCQIKTGSMVQAVSSIDGGCSVLCVDGSEDAYDGCIISVQAPDALKILGRQLTNEEMRILGAFQYVSSDIFLHHDKRLMPHNQSAWSAWNFLGNTSGGVCVTYWLNVLQNLGSTSLPFLVTLNPPCTPADTVLKWRTSHHVPSVAALNASLELQGIQGNRKIWFAGAYHGYGKGGLKAGIAAAHAMLSKSCTILRNKKLTVPSLVESGARLLVTRFLGHYIISGRLLLLEEGGTTFVFQGTNKQNSHKKSVIKIFNPQFYWKIAMESDLGFANAYIDGDFSFVDTQEGLLNFFMLFADNRDLWVPSEKQTNIRTRGWWTPLFPTAVFGSARYFLHHISRKNTLMQARRNISQHYDLSNDLFSLFLGETMAYSCAIFKTEEEDLQEAQLRKFSVLIEKARVNSSHDVLEIGCGWGTFAIEIVKQTGCKYTGITLSEEQLKFAKRKVKEAGLEDHMTFLLCDYRQLPRGRKYDRIVSCEMIEAVGHEYMEEFFSCCDSFLGEGGLFVLQTTSIPDEWYSEYRRTPDFIKEYIFPGVCAPSLSRMTSAMANASRLRVENAENIGGHFYRTLICWRDNFKARRSEILELGFDEKFIRTWEYYFIYCAAGFKSRTLLNYQVVFSRPGSLKAFDGPHKFLPSES